MTDSDRYMLCKSLLWFITSLISGAEKVKTTPMCGLQRLVAIPHDTSSGNGLFGYGGQSMAIHLHDPFIHLFMATKTGKNEKNIEVVSGKWQSCTP